MGGQVDSAVGKDVVVAARRRLIIFGKLLRFDRVARRAILTDAQMVRYWPSDCGGFRGMVTGGPRKARLGPVLPEAQVNDVEAIALRAAGDPARQPGEGELLMTQEILDLGMSVGACSVVGELEAGMPLHDVRAEHLEWFAERFPEVAERVAKEAKIPGMIFGCPALWAHGYGRSGIAEKRSEET